MQRMKDLPTVNGFDLIDHRGIIEKNYIQLIFLYMISIYLS